MRGAYLAVIGFSGSHLLAAGARVGRMADLALVQKEGRQVLCLLFDA